MRLSIFVLAIFVCCFVLPASAQQHVKDSVNYYEHQIGRIYRHAMDSIYHSDSLRYYEKQVRRAKDRSKSYFSFMLFTEALSADFGGLNAAIAKDGFGPMSNAPYWRAGLGFSRKAYNGIMIDFTYMILGFNRVVRKGDEKVTANLSELLGLQLGYAVVNCRKFTVYPYAGLDLRLASLSYDKPAVVNPAYNSIASLLINDQSTSGGNGPVSYQAGLGIDWVMHENERRHGGTIVFGKFGTARNFGNDTYSINGVDIPSGIKYGAWAAQLGFKFFGR